MSSLEKEKARLRSCPRNLKYPEFMAVMRRLGYFVDDRGRTSGLAVVFQNFVTGDSIFIHKPHPSPDVDRGCLKAVVKHLIEKGVL